MVENSRSKEDRERDNHRRQGAHQASEKRHRAFLEDATHARSARTPESPVRGDQAGFTRAARTDQARASPRRSDAGRGLKVATKTKAAAAEKIGLHNLVPAPGSHRN